jgi:2-desacetyl-2-hydroxyethyl bacteriochlorophyllide A dehydrogenase
VKVKRIVFAAREKVTVETAEADMKPAPSEVLIESAYTMLSQGTELAALTQTHSRSNIPEPPAWLKFPSVPGYLMGGTIVEKGSDVKGFEVGEKVVGEGNGCWNTHAQFVRQYAHPSWLVKVPAGITFQQAASAKLGSVAMYGLRVLGHEFGDTLCVFGLGVIGQIAVRYAAVAGFSRVVGVDPIPSRRAVASKVPGVTAVAPDDAAVAGDAKFLNEGFDCVIEASGNPKAFNQACMVARRRGKVSVVSAPHAPAEVRLYDQVMSRSLQIFGAHGSSQPGDITWNDRWNERRQKEFYMRLIAERRMDVAPIFTHDVPVDQAPALYEGVLRKPADYLGVVFKWK